MRDTCGLCPPDMSPLQGSISFPIPYPGRRFAVPWAKGKARLQRSGLSGICRGPYASAFLRTEFPGVGAVWSAGAEAVAPAGDGRRPRFGLARSAPSPRVRPLAATATCARRPRTFRLRREPKRRRRALLCPLPPHSKRRNARHTAALRANRCGCHGPLAGRKHGSIGMARSVEDGRGGGVGCSPFFTARGGRPRNDRRGRGRCGP